MFKVIIGLFILLLFVLFVLLSWIIVLTVALLIFPRKGKKTLAPKTGNGLNG